MAIHGGNDCCIVLYRSYDSIVKQFTRKLNQIYSNQLRKITQLSILRVLPRKMRRKEKCLLLSGFDPDRVIHWNHQSPHLGTFGLSLCHDRLTEPVQGQSILRKRFSPGEEGVQ